MKYLSDPDLQTMVDVIYNTLRPPYLSTDDEEDMRQEIALGIIEADALVEDTNSAEAFMYEYGLGYGRKYLSRDKIPYNDTTVNISSVNSLGLEVQDDGYDPDVGRHYDLCNLGRTIKELDHLGWVRAHFGIDVKPKTYEEIARDSGYSRTWVIKYINGILDTVKARFNEDAEEQSDQADIQSMS